MQPILLRASSRQKACNYVVTPRQLDEVQHVCVLYRQSVHVPVYHLTKSEEFPINVAHYEVASMCHHSTTIFITSSPIFTLHYEFCPPSDKIEEFTNPRLCRVSDLTLKPSDHSTGKLFCMDWLNLKLTTAYGIHSAVQRVIGTEPIRKVKKFQAQKLRIQKRQAVDLPQPNVCESLLLKAPEKGTLELCTTKEPQADVEEQFYDAVESCEISVVSSSHTVEICESNVCNK